MGLYKICEHKGRTRDRCEHAWWGSFRGIRVSLPRWANRDLHSKAEAQGVLDQVRTAIREGAFDPRGQAPCEVSQMTFREFADKRWACPTYVSTRSSSDLVLSATT